MILLRLLSTVFAADSELQNAVNQCLTESPVEGNCPCPAGTCGQYTGPIWTWDVSLVTDMSNLFNGKSDFNGNISEWNTLNVEDMGQMYVIYTVVSMIDPFDCRAHFPLLSICRFWSATSFNGDLSKWITEKVVDMDGMYVISVRFQ